MRPTEKPADTRRFDHPELTSILVHHIHPVQSCIYCTLIYPGTLPLNVQLCCTGDNDSSCIDTAVRYALTSRSMGTASADSPRLVLVALLPAVDRSAASLHGDVVVAAVVEYA